MEGDFVFNSISSSTRDLCGGGTVLYPNCGRGDRNLHVQKKLRGTTHTNERKSNGNLIRSVACTDDHFLVFILWYHVLQVI